MPACTIASGEAVTQQGRCGRVLAELNADRKAPRVPAGDYRQCLLNLADRLARVQAMGGEYARVSFSPYVEAQRRQRCL
jgi:hypothetical protein